MKIDRSFITAVLLVLGFILMSLSFMVADIPLSGKLMMEGFLVLFGSLVVGLSEM